MPPTILRDPELSDAFRRHGGAIRRYVRSLLRSPAEAEEVTQETFVRAQRRLSSLEDPARLSPWLYRIATNLSYDQLRRSAGWRRWTRARARSSAKPIRQRLGVYPFAPGLRPHSVKRVMGDR